jgi:hypothetical protein
MGQQDLPQEGLQGSQQGRNWQVRILRRGWPFGSAEMRPADVGNDLAGLMLSSGSVLEDVNYTKIVPNRYIVEVNEDNYARNYQPIAARIVQQWTERMLRRLMTANSRLGRREYRFGGRVTMEIRPVSNLSPSQARVIFRIDTDDNEAPPGARAGTGVPCLQMLPAGPRYNLTAPLISMGRDAACDIRLDMPLVQQARLVSGRHAFLRQEGGRLMLHDGAPYGRPSLNGTFVNGRAVPQGGYPLQNGDTIILAALDPNDPRPDTPGVVTFRYTTNCG